MKIFEQDYRIKQRIIENKKPLLSLSFKKLLRKFPFLIILSGLFISFLSFHRVFESQENLFYDIYLQLRPLQKISSKIAVIEIDDETLNRLGQWPLPRDFHASLVDILDEVGAKMIAFDLIFSEPTEYDAVFAESIRKAGNVYLPEVLSFSEDANARHILDHPNEILVPLVESLSGNIAGKGHINVLIDHDGKIRKTPLFVKYEKGFLPQLGLQMACGYLGLNCSDLQFFEDHSTVGGRLNIPVYNKNELLINYPGKWKETFNHFSYLEILAAYKGWKEGGEFGRLAELKDKVCFVGLTAAGTVDLKSSPLENRYPMLGLNVSVFNSVLEQSFLRRASREINILFALLVYLFCLFICLKCKPRVSFFSCVLLVIFCLTLTAGLLIGAGVWIDIFFPLLIILSVYLICVSLRWAKDRYQREILEKEMRIARDIQMQFLVGPKEEYQDRNVAVWFQPALYVAGDFYDVFHTPDHKTGILVGDVSGKGLPAALCMAQTISLFRIFSRQQSLPEQALMQLNHELCLRGTNRFATALYCVVDLERRVVKVASAGHGPMFFYRDKEKNIEEVSLTARPPLGVLDETVYEAKEIAIYPGDKIFLFSDGVSEARNKDGKEMGIEKIKEGILSGREHSNEEILNNLRRMVVEYVGQGVQHDDITMIVFSFQS